MGNFYTNVTLLGADPAAVQGWLRASGRRCYLGTWGQHTVVFDEAGEAQDGSHAGLAAELAAAIGCGAIAALNHDDDVLLLQAFSSEVLVGEYNSCPDYFADMDEDGEEGVDGEPGAPSWSHGFGPDDLVRLCGTGTPATLAAIMQTDEVFAVDLHAKIAAELGLPGAACGVGYTYLAQGVLPTDTGNDAIQHLDPPA